MKKFYSILILSCFLFKIEECAQEFELGDNVIILDDYMKKKLEKKIEKKMRKNTSVKTQKRQRRKLSVQEQKEKDIEKLQKRIDRVCYQRARNLAGFVDELKTFVKEAIFKITQNFPKFYNIVLHYAVYPAKFLAKKRYDTETNMKIRKMNKIMTSTHIQYDIQKNYKQTKLDLNESLMLAQQKLKASINFLAQQIDFVSDETQ